MNNDVNEAFVIVTMDVLEHSPCERRELIVSTRLSFSSLAVW